MNEEGFLNRWSRLKRQTRDEAEPVPAEIPGEAPPEDRQADEPFDLSSLPSIESLGGDSDYTPFLARGVPEELQRLALRQAWRSDPKIVEFRGFAEYDWDCNAPGYGQLLPVDNLKRLCNAVLGEPAPAKPREEPPTMEEPAPTASAVVTEPEPELAELPVEFPAQPVKMSLPVGDPGDAEPVETGAKRDDSPGAILAEHGHAGDMSALPGGRKGA